MTYPVIKTAREPAPFPTLLTFAQACAALQISDTTLRGIVRAGQLKAAKVGAQWRIRSDDLNAYLEGLCSAAAASSGTTTSPSTATATVARPAFRGSGTRKPTKTENAVVYSWEKHAPFQR